MDNTEDEKKLYNEVWQLMYGNQASYDNVYDLSITYVYGIIYTIVSDCGMSMEETQTGFRDSATQEAINAIVNQIYSYIYYNINTLKSPEDFYDWAGEIARTETEKYMKRIGRYNETSATASEDGANTVKQVETADPDAAQGVAGVRREAGEKPAQNASGQQPAGVAKTVNGASGQQSAGVAKAVKSTSGQFTSKGASPTVQSPAAKKNVTAVKMEPTAKITTPAGRATAPARKNASKGLPIGVKVGVGIAALLIMGGVVALAIHFAPNSKTVGSGQQATPAAEQTEKSTKTDAEKITETQTEDTTAASTETTEETTE